MAAPHNPKRNFADQLAVVTAQDWDFDLIRSRAMTVLPGIGHVSARRDKWLICAWLTDRPRVHAVDVNTGDLAQLIADLREATTYGQWWTDTAISGQFDRNPYE